jgi:signal transduction histidine kinase/CheY-like chemotaxis protein
MRATVCAMSAVVHPTLEPALRAAAATVEALARDWPGAALAIDAHGAVLAASAAVADCAADLAPLTTPEPGTGLLQDRTGAHWCASAAVGGTRLAIRDAPPERAASIDEARRFTAALSHEIRTPLNGLLGLAALLEETGLSPSQSEYVAAIRKSGARLLDLLNNVLDYARMGEGRLPLEESPFPVADLVQDVAELIAPRAHAAGLDLAAVVDPVLPTHMVGDAGRLRQILFNLAGNAVKFTEHGAVLIAAAPRLDGTGLSLSVRDTGMGVPHEARTRLFEAFGQARIADARRDGGVGLGLAIVAQLVSVMGGRIEVQSEPGRGALFRVDLPLVPAPGLPPRPHVLPGRGRAPRALLDLRPASALACAAALAGDFALLSDGDPANADLAILDAALPPARIAAAARVRPTLVVMRPEDRAHIPNFRDLGCAGYLIRPLRPASVLERARLAVRGVRQSEPPSDTIARGQAGRVLIADDNAVNALLASRALAAAGFAADIASTGAEVLERAGQTLYSVIFMDIRMPVMDGLEASRRIRALAGQAARTPIVALTADLDSLLADRAREAGISAIAAKPIDPNQLRQLAETWAGTWAEASRAMERSA